MVKAAARGASRAGQVLTIKTSLHGREILLRRGKIPRLQIGRKLIKRLIDRAAANLVDEVLTALPEEALLGGASRGGGRRRKGCLQAGEVGLRGRQIPRLESLAELLELLHWITGGDLV